MTEPALEVIGLTKYFKKVKVLANINFTLLPGEIAGLVGPNGAGKTTLLKILSTLILPSQGQVFINGHDLEKDGHKVRSSLGLMTGEERSFYWRLTGRQNLEFFSTLYGLKGREARKRIEELFSILKIDEPDKRVDKYSTGLKQRLGLARGLLHNPPVLLMDEPTKSLDPLSAEYLRNFILKELVENQKKTVLFTTHRLEEVDNFCQRLLIIKAGEILIQGKVEDLRKKASFSGENLTSIILRLLKPNVRI